MWYVLQVKTGCEESIRDKLIELGYHAIVPIANRLIRSKGSWNKKKTIIFTGYVFVNLDYDAENYYRITSMDNVVKFLGDKNDPLLHTLKLNGFVF
jgi:transcriptional antiterminator NusG